MAQEYEDRNWEDCNNFRKGKTEPYDKCRALTEMFCKTRGKCKFYRKKFGVIERREPNT